MIRSRLAIAALVSLLFSSALLAQAAPDDLVITGAGWGKGWDTEIELADSELGLGTSGTIFKVNDLLAPCPPNCDSTSYTIPPKGTVRVRVSDFLQFFQGPLTLHVTTNTEQPLPIVRARVFKDGSPCQSSEIPVFRNPTNAPRSFPVLVFPGLSRQPGVYSNLILQNLSNDTAEAFVEAFGPDGQRLGGELFTLGPEGAMSPLVVVDVANRFGAAEVDGGQVRVTKHSGNLWGVLATVYADGRLAVVPGVNP